MKTLVLRLVCVSVLVLLLASPSLAQQVWPGRVQVGINAGFNGYFGNETNGGVIGYQLGVEASARVAAFRVGSLWLGAGFNYAGLNTPSVPHDFQPWIFAKLTFEKRLRVPLVPLLQLGIGGDFLAEPGGDGGALLVRVGGGLDYWFLKWMAAGVQTIFSLGPRFSPSNGGIYPNFYGSVEISGGVRFAF
jgi:hypothetical protein